ncbi:MAG: SDR family oxidoreductase [Parvularculaceae bacterium]
MTARSVLVTGGAKRVGAAIASHLAGRGWRVAVHFHNDPDEAREFAKSIGGESVQADLSDPAVAESLPVRVAQAFGAPLDAVVNSASVFHYNEASNFTIEDWNRDQTVNLLSPVLIARALAAQLPEGREGAVVNILDQKLWNLNADFFSYTLSKIGLEGATRMLARALAPKVRVNGLAPGLILPSGGQSEEEFKAVASKYNLLKRPIALGDIAAGVAFLLETGSIAGHTLLVDNGQHMVASDHDIMFRTRGTKRPDTGREG